MSLISLYEDELYKEYDLEIALKESIDKEAFLRLGIPLYCLPEITRPLPRLYQQTKPHRVKVKEPFSSLPALKKQFIDKALLHLYSGYNVSKKQKLILFTWVIGDGLGDYFSQIEIAKILQEAHPELSITLITMVDKNLSVPTLPISCTQYWIPYRAIEGSKWQKIAYDPFPASIMKTMETASVILQTPTYFPDTAPLFKTFRQCSGPKCELLGESGWIETPYFHPLSGGRCMGLHYLEKGIFIKNSLSFSPSETIYRIENKRILSALFRTAYPSQKQILSYLTTHRFNLAYLRHDEGLYLYLCSLLQSLEGNEQPIDLCVSTIKSLICHFEDQYRPLFAKYHVKAVILYWDHQMSEISLSSQGKVLRIIQTPTLSHQDYLRLLSMTQDLAGCRGDGSIFEAISANKLPFFDLPFHKRSLLKDLIAIACFYLPDRPEIRHYLELFLSTPSLYLAKSSEEWMEELEPFPFYPLEELGKKIGRCLQNPELLEGMKVLYKRIRETYSIEPVLCNLILRALSHHRYPQLSLLEESALHGFLTGDKPISQSLYEIRDDLESYGIFHF